MLALSIRQPYAELILRGIKTVEYRSRATRIIGRRFHIYAPQKRVEQVDRRKIWSADLQVAGKMPAWMIELMEQIILGAGDLPTGVIVGSAVIERVSSDATRGYRWHLGQVQRADTIIKPQRQPQPVWFKPF